MTMAWLGTVLAALGLAGMVFLGARVVFTPAYHHVLEYAGVQQRDRVADLVLGFLDVNRWKRRLQWAAWDDDAWQDRTLPGLARRSLLLALIGLGLVVMAGAAPLLWPLPLLLALLPWRALKSAAERARRRAVAALPFAASVLAAELAAGVAPEDALRRAVQVPGPLQKLLEQALVRSEREGLPLFGQPGALVQTFSDLDAPPALRAFARELNQAALKGVGGVELMAALSQAQLREFREALKKRIAQVDSALWPIIVVFFFFPLLGLLLYVSLMPVIRLLG